MTDGYYCPHGDYILTEFEVWYADLPYKQDPRCPHCNQPVDHIGDSGPYDTLEEKEL